MLDDNVRAQIRSEIQQISDLFSEFAPLLAKPATAEPDAVEKTALASIIHSFYTGIEGIFLVIAKRVDEQIPTGERWHRDLLDQISKPNSLRAFVITADTKEALQNYLAFRHFFRQAYVYVLRWEEMRDLVVQMESTWITVKKEIETFISQ